MKEMDILQAVGQVEDRFLQELEAPAAQSRKSRNVWRIALAAAIISMLSLSAVAAPAILSALKGGQVQNKGEERFPYVSIYGYDNGIQTSGYEVKVTIDVDPDAPATMQEARIPHVLLQNHPSEHCVWADYGLEYNCKYTYADGSKGDIRFGQYVIPEGGNGTYRVRCCQLDVEPEKQMIRIGDLDVMQILFRDDGKYGGIRQLYWSDGMYIYYLMVDLDVPAEFYESVVLSVRPVENIEDYLTPGEYNPPALNAPPTEPDEP